MKTRSPATTALLIILAMLANPSLVYASEQPEPINGTVYVYYTYPKFAEALPQHSATFIEHPDEIIFGNTNSHSGLPHQDFSISDDRTMSLLVDLLLQAEPLKDIPDIEIDNNLTCFRITLKKAGEEEYFADLYWSSWLYPDTYVLLPGEARILPGEAGDLLNSMFGAMAQGAHDTDINPAHQQLFDGHGWGVVSRLNRLQVLLPETSGISIQDESSYFWTFANVAMQSEHMDISPFYGKDVQVDIYKLYPKQWGAFPGVENPRGIVLSKDDMLIGAFVDNAYRSSEAWNLSGVSVDDLLPGTLIEYLTDQTHMTPLEQELAAMDARSVLEIYMEAMVADDFETMLACTHKERSLEGMCANVYQTSLYKLREERMADPWANGPPLRVISIEPYDGGKEGDLVFHGTVELSENKFDPPAGNVVSTYYVMRKETERTGWKVAECNSGM
ncbi:MAG TPA: hypothetical protein PKE04_03055 [Clostridia bacterium]|nr:hypothetical protein [Clostridia bacterium]